MSGRNAQLRAELEAFGTVLEAAGFRVYRPGGTWTFLGFAREVNGRWCSATVQAGGFGLWEWDTLIVPSREDGSSAFLVNVPPSRDLTVKNARAVTIPRVTNPVLTRARENAGWPEHWG